MGMEEVNLTNVQVEEFKQKYGITVIATNCNNSAADDKSLPVDSYILTLEHEDETWQDIVKGVKVKIFDAYYDTFGHCIKSMEYTKGTISAKLWGNTLKSKEKKKK